MVDLRDHNECKFNIYFSQIKTFKSIQLMIACYSEEESHGVLQQAISASLRFIISAQAVSPSFL